MDIHRLLQAASLGKRLYLFWNVRKSPITSSD